MKARLLKGFRDFGPQELRQRRRLMQIFIENFEKYGFEPLETPALEYFDILMDKYGEEEKLVYSFEDHGQRKVALKYDLTVPTARYVAQNFSNLTFPWKRYQIQPVWRGDNTQKGRFREFYQCDADIFGVKDVVADAEYIRMGLDIISQIGFENFKVRLNNRKILNGIAEFAGRPDKFFDVVYAIDKWDKRSEEETHEDLQIRGLSKEEASKVVDAVKADLASLGEMLKSSRDGAEGVEEIKRILNYVGNDKVVYDSTIARGLAYYTGPIWEWNIVDGGVGSIGGCGRYDKLVGSFIGQDLPATGGSFGFERIAEVMKDKGMFEDIKSQIEILVTIFDEKFAKQSFELADNLRDQGIRVELFPDTKKLGKQFEYADKRNIPYVAILGEEEIKNGEIALKNMKTGEQTKTTIQNIKAEMV